MKTSLSVKEEDYKKFMGALLEAIDESLNQVLGEAATQTIYFHLQRKFRLKREDIPENLEVFGFALEGIFGIGALVIEKTIMENLYSRLSLKNKNLRLKYENAEQFNFINYITDLRNIGVKEAVNTPSVVPHSFLM